MANLDFTTKKRNLFIVLSGIFLTNAILAEIIGVKIFSAEGTFTEYEIYPQKIMSLIGCFGRETNISR